MPWSSAWASSRPTMTARRPSLAAVAAVTARLIRLGGGTVDENVAAGLHGLGNRIFELANLVPPGASPVRSSRFTRIRGPPSSSLRCSSRSRGVGNAASCNRGSRSRRSRSCASGKFWRSSKVSVTKSCRLWADFEIYSRNTLFTKRLKENIADYSSGRTAKVAVRSAISVSKAVSCVHLRFSYICFDVTEIVILQWLLAAGKEAKPPQNMDLSSPKEIGSGAIVKAAHPPLLRSPAWIS